MTAFAGDDLWIRDLTDEFHSASLQANLGDLATDFIGLVRSQLVSNTVRLSIHTVEGEFTTFNLGI